MCRSQVFDIATGLGHVGFLLVVDLVSASRATCCTARINVSATGGGHNESSYQYLSLIVQSGSETVARRVSWRRATPCRVSWRRVTP